MPDINHRAKAEELLALADEHNLTDDEERAQAAVLAQLATAHALLATQIVRVASNRLGGL